MRVFYHDVFKRLCVHTLHILTIFSSSATATVFSFSFFNTRTKMLTLCVALQRGLET